ncbi:MAG: hypothetical protein Q9185_001076 [Variospora sp. 1 TL-2023]
MSHPSPAPLNLLILGAGWTSTFLLPLLDTNQITYAATTRTGHAIPHLPTTIPFTFDPENSDLAPYHALPRATTILITFPLRGPGPSTHLVSLYNTVHGGEKDQRRWIQLGSTGVWKGGSEWVDRHSAIDGENPRAVAEEELLSVLGERACVLNLAGLWGGERDPKNWVERVAKCKADVRGKGALHLVHGEDVARGVVGVMGNWEGVGGGRWIVDDLRGWDWWDLILGWKGKEEEEDGEYAKWVLELMEEEGVRALPRGKEKLGRVLDGREFWGKMGMVPSRSLLR